MSPHDNGQQDDRDATNYVMPPASTDAHGTRDSEDPPGNGSTVAYIPPPNAAEKRLPRRFGGYELLEELGHGGMGVVYKAREFTPERMVALKVIRSGELADTEDVRRFRKEANEAARLDHAHIVPVYEVGEHGGLHFFTMKLVEGGSLSHHLERYQSDVKASARLVATASRAVHYAHQRQLLHRDLKPGNILLDASGAPHVADFGLAKRMGEAGEASQSQGVGTPEYMAPEQARGDARLTTAADVYALGGVLYALLTGRPPFRGDSSWTTIEKVLTEEPTPPSKIRPGAPRDLETICLKCLQKEPAQRYGSAEALADDLERWLRGELVQGRAVGRMERVWRWGRRNSTLAGLYGVAALALLLGVIGGGATWLWRQAEAARTQAESERQTAQKERGEKEALLAQSFYDAGQLALRQGGWRTCLDKIDLALKAGYPNSVNLRLDRVQALFALHNLPETDLEIQTLSRRSDLGNLKGQVLLWQAERALNHFWHDEHALEQVKQALALPLPSAEAAYARGLLAPTSPQAVALFQEALNADPYFQRASDKLGLLLILLGRRAEARVQIRNGESRFPVDPNFRLLHSFLEALEGREKEADAQLKSALALAHLNPAQTEIIHDLVRLASQAALLPELFSTDSNASLLAAVIRIAPLTPRLRAAVYDPNADLFLPIPPVLYEAMRGLPAEFGVATLLFNKDGIVRGLDHALEVHPEGMLFLARAMMLAQRDNKEGWTKAEQDYLKASETPAIIEIQQRALYMAASAEWVLDRDYGPLPEMRKRSLDNFRKLMALGNLDADQLFNLTVMARSMKNAELARWVVDQWARQAPDDPRLREQQAGVAFEAGEYHSAITLLDALLKKNPPPAEEKRWHDLRAAALTKLQAQARDAADGAAK